MENNYHCNICNDEMWLYEEDEYGYEYAKPCSCQKIRKSLYLAEKSGLGELLDIYTFDKFTTEKDWQKALKDNALLYTKEPTNKWFTALGQSGCGKSFICTAICKELLAQGKQVIYMSWIEESGKLKRSINEFEYSDLIDMYKYAEVLYIDDFWKADNNTPPTNADIKLANEILNFRYNRARASKKTCKTIISSERLMEQLKVYDEAIAGRISEMSYKYLNELKGKTKNCRINFL